MLRSKTANLILSILIAVVLWSYVIYTVEPTQTRTFVNVPVTVLNEEVLNERDLAVADSDSILIDVKVKGKRQTVSAMSNDDIKATVDVSECVEGDNVLEVNIDFDESVSLANNATITVHVYVDQIVTESRNVIVSYSGEAEDISYELTSAQSVDVTGAKATVDDVSYIKAELGDKDLPEGEEEISVDLVPVDTSDREVKGVSMSETSATVKVYSAGTKEIPLTVNTTGSLPDGYTFGGIDAPSTITVKGSAATLEDIKEITCDDIDISEMTEDTEVTLVPKLPDGVALASDQGLTATVRISRSDEINTVTISTDDIEILNLGEGLKATVNSDNIRVTSTSDITAGDIHLSVDLDGLEAGSHKVSINTEAAEGLEITLSKQRITVNIIEE